MTNPSADPNSNQALMECMYAAAIAGDFEKVMSCLSEDLVVHEPPFLPYGGIYNGPREFAEMIPKVSALLDLATLTVDRYIASGDRVIGIIRMQDRTTREDVLLAEESRIVDGKVTEIWVYYHNTQAMNQ